MRLNHEYWCEPECTWQTNSINKTATQVKKWKTWQLGFQTLERYWASFQVTRLFHSAITRIKSCCVFFEGGGGGAQLQCIYYLVLYTDLKAAEGN